MPTSVQNFNFLALFVSERVSQNLMWELLPPCCTRTLKLLCAPAKFQHRIVQFCGYVFPVGFSLHVPKMGFLGVLGVKM